MKRPVNGINSVLASAFVLILMRPSVIFDAGFLLSYSAVIFIICFYRDLYLKISFRHRIPDLIWQSAAVTIIAQAGTLPLTLMLFNRFPVWFILSNIVIVPLSSLVVITGVLVLMTYRVQFLSHLLARILDFLTWLTEMLTEKASSLPFSTIENIGITSIECILLTITIFLFTRFLLNRKSIPILYPLTALLLFIAAGTVKDIATMKSGELIVYNTAGYTTIGIRTGSILNYYSDTIVPVREISRHSAMLNLKERRNIISGNTNIEIDGNMNVLITGFLTGSLLKSTSPDIVILTGARPEIEKNILSGRSLKALVIGSEAIQRFRFPLTDRLPAADTVHFVRTEGAFCRKL
jgi:competence protein ComEC